MTSRKKKKTERVIFDSIRKPTAPSSKKFGGGDKREDKTDPVQRKVKHKKKQRETENDADIS